MNFEELDLGKLVSDFVSLCLEQGINTSSGMIQKGKDEIDLLEKEIEFLFQKMQKIRLNQNHLKMIVKQLGGDKPKKPIPTSLLTHDHEITTEFKDLCGRICDLVENSVGGLSPSQIRDTLGESECYTACKWLWDRKILSRDEKNNGKITLLIKGSHWNNRPTVESKI